MGNFIVWYIFISAIIGLPRSLISIPVFGFLYILNGGASGSNSDILGWFSLLVVAGINTSGMVANIRRIKKHFGIKTIEEKFIESANSAMASAIKELNVSGHVSTVCPFCSDVISVVELKQESTLETKCACGRCNSRTKSYA